MELAELSEFCLAGVCKRRLRPNHVCSKLHKQEKCLKKINKPKKEKKPKKIKHKTDGEWVKTKKIIHERDLTCRIYAILTREELNYLHENFPGFNKGNSAGLGVAHIEPKSIRRDLYYDSENLVLCSWFFHFRLDNFQHPVTGAPITKEEARAWFQAARLRDRNEL